ncbi:hypothetical protein LCGC14_1511720 [marine sediment metagenome]|uniref:DUF6788 domain-containing protein n=1 Tax=marine sediment metagenome TaxID=412755 RepID=A0A0F9JLY1_9ZZZZ
MLTFGGTEAKKGMCHSRVRIEERVYEYRYVRCGAKGCWCGNNQAGRKAGHGPYWYLCGADVGHWRKIYLGRELDTTLWRTSDGGIDWRGYDKHRRFYGAENVGEEGWLGSLESVAVETGGEVINGPNS